MSPTSAPFTQFVIKLHSRCDLACTHCYVYEHADQSWMGRPLGMSRRTLSQTAKRIAEHAAAHGLDEVHVVLHGGEPLLIGAERMRETLAELVDVIPPTLARLDLRIHTNGVLLDEEYCELFSAYNVKVGVSLDGDRAANDRHRLYRDGRSSYDKVTRSLELLRRAEYRHLYAGLLCTVDIANDPEAVYQGLLEHEPPRIDLLLPHSTWLHQPPGLERPRDLGDPRRGGLPDGGGEYAAWLKRVFDLWDREGRPVPVRILDSILAALNGRPSQTETLGLAAIDLLVVETDGEIEQADSLKTAFDGAPATGFNVFDHDLDTVSAHPGFAARRHGVEGLSATCRACPVVAVCGGGLYAHRFAAGNGFDNPSVFCADLNDLIEHVRGVSQVPSSELTAIPTPSEPLGDSAVVAHTLRRDEWDALGAGYGSAETIRNLAEAQRSVNRDLLALIANAGPQQDKEFIRAWELIAALDRSHPQSLDHILTHAYTRVWAVRYLSATRDDRSSAAATGYLSALAAAASVHAGIEEYVPVSAVGGVIPLPTFGALVAPAGTTQAVVETGSGGRVTIRLGDRQVRIDTTRHGAAGSSTDPAWQGVRRLHADGLDVALEDTDPYRDCHTHATGRLGRAEADQWNEAFHQAMAFVDNHLPDYAPGLRAGLTTVMPMVPNSDRTHRSAAARHAFGAVGAALPEDPSILALLLVHEFQHVKLGAILDLYDIYDRSDTAERYYAPWRPDPRPLEGLLQGTYAHIAVTEYFRVARTILDGAAARTAEANFARWREHTADAVTELSGAASLSALGEQFVRAMGETVTRWLDESVSADARAAARRSALEHRAAYERTQRAVR